jgi:hypothetical protein
VIGAFYQREQALGRLAARQHWVVTHRQLASLGFGRHAIDHRLRAGRLRRLYRGVCGGAGIRIATARLGDDAPRP